MWRSSFTGEQCYVEDQFDVKMQFHSVEAVFYGGQFFCGGAALC